jgi:vancomycin resistance protein YoaR
MGDKAAKSRTAKADKIKGGKKKIFAGKAAGKAEKTASAIKTLAAELQAVQLPEVAEPKPHEKKQKKPLALSLREHANSLKDYAGETVSSFKKDVDPEKVATLKKETVKILKYGTVYFMAIIAAASLLILPEAYFSEKTLANTFVGDVKIGMLPAETAKLKIQEAADKYLKQPLDFTYNGRSVTLTPQDLGIGISADKTANKLPVRHLAEANTFEILGSFIAPRHISASLSMNDEKILQKLEKSLDLEAARAKDARLTMKDGQFEVVSESPGEKINGEKLLAALQNDVGNFNSAPITVELEEEMPRITAEKLASQKEQIQELLKKQITLKYGAKKLKINLLDHLDAVGVKTTTEVKLGQTGITLPYAVPEEESSSFKNDKLQVVTKTEAEIIPSKIDDYLRENFIKDIESPASAVNISRGKDGKITIEGKGEDGKSVPEDRLMAAINAAVNSGSSIVQAPVMTEKAPVNISEDLSRLGIKELLATGHTSYYGSPPNRIHNIDIGIAKYNGVLVKPGEEFSFNALLGEVDASGGYLPEKVIKQNKIEIEYGGGICQVSTTLYRAILLAGLPITERNPHSWKVAYYGQVLGDGLDATIYLGVSDVKFINDTPASLLIQAYSEGANAYFKLYGTSDGRTARLEGPFGGGLHYKWYRIINKNGQEIKESIVSNYKPIPAPEPAKPTA